MPAPLKIACFVLLANGEIRIKFWGLKPKLACLVIVLMTFRIQNCLTMHLSSHPLLMSLPPNAFQRLPLTEETYTSLRLATQKICISHAKVANISSEETSSQASKLR